MRKFFAFVAAALVAMTMNAITVNEAIAAGMALDSMAVSETEYTVEGYVINASSFSTMYMNQTWYMADDATATASDFQAYNCFPIEGNDTLKVLNGDKVSVTGKLKKYYNRAAQKYIIEIEKGNATFITKTAGDHSVSKTVQEITVARALEIGNALADNASTENLYKIKGYVSAVNVKTTDAWSDQYKEQSFWVMDTLGNGKTNAEGAFYVYRGKPENEQELEEGTYVEFTCTIKKYVPSNGGDAVIESAVQILVKIFADAPAPDTLTVSQAVTTALLLPDNETSNRKYAIVGYVAKISAEYNDQYHNISFYMADEATSTIGELNCYRVRVTAEQAANIVPGVYVVVTGKLRNNYYNEVNSARTEIGAKLEFSVPPVIYTARATVYPTNAGSVEIVYDNHLHRSAILNAIPYEGYHFVQWNDNLLDNPRTVILTQDTILTAIFAPNVYNVNVTCDALYGHIEGESGDFEYLTTHVYEAVPNYGYHFMQWSDGSTSNPYSIIVTHDIELAAGFAPNVYTVSSAYTPQGIVSGTGSFIYNSQCTVEAIPNAGYHFVQWLDGETANPRTFILTQDTIFGAVFAKDTTGLCGKDYALTWSYDSKSQTLTISGTGAFNEHMECGVDAKMSMRNLIINEGVTIIGANAFSGCTNLTSLQLPTSLKNIGERAFANCSELISIYNYRERPGIVSANTFEGVNKFDCTLYVLAGSIDMYRSEGSNWKDFYFIEPIGSSQVSEPITEVDVEPSDNNATITWPTSEGAAIYTIQISKDGVVVCTLIFNANGQLTGIAFAPSRNNGSQAPFAMKTNNGGLCFTVTGLESGTYYNLTITAKDISDNVVDSYSANFTTTGGENTPTDFENVSAIHGESTKLLRDGQIFILRGDKTYTITGQELK